MVEKRVRALVPQLSVVSPTLDARRRPLTLSTDRIEALCDGVFAIAMTLLVLDIPLPRASTTGTWALLHALWPDIASYVASFAVLGVYWVGQHTQFHFIRHADQVLLWMTLLFLMLIAAMPFSAALIGHFDFRRWTVLFYGCHLIAIGALHNFIWRYASYKNRLLEPSTNITTIRLLNQTSAMPIVVYGVALVLSFINTYLSVLVYALVPIALIVRAVLPKHRLLGD